MTRVAAHHFADVAARRRASWRGSPASASSSSTRSIGGERAEEAEKLRDPSHVAQLQRGASGASFFADAGLEVEEVGVFDEPVDFEPWLERTGCDGRGRRARRASCSPTGSTATASTSSAIALQGAEAR